MRLLLRFRLVALAGLFLLAGAAGAAAGGGKGKGQGKAGPSCRTAADCVLVPDGCCSCREGGKQRAIPAAASAAYEKKRKAACKETLCPQLMSEDPSCQAPGAACKEGACTLGS